MLSTDKYSISVQRALLPVVMCCVTASARAQTSTDMISGTLDKVDSGATAITVKAADGASERVKFTDETTVAGLKNAAKGVDLAGKEGGHVIIHTAAKGTEKTGSFSGPDRR
jgi:hypothetical protein